jgi:hypothetical protein
LVLENSVKALEKVASDGIEDFVSYPQMRLKVTSVFIYSIKVLV